MNQILYSYSPQFKCFNHECQMLTLYLNSVQNISAHEWQQHMIEICFYITIAVYLLVLFEKCTFKSSNDCNF